MFSGGVYKVFVDYKENPITNMVSLESVCTLIPEKACFNEYAEKVKGLKSVVFYNTIFVNCFNKGERKFQVFHPNFKRSPVLDVFHSTDKVGVNNYFNSEIALADSPFLGDVSLFSLYGTMNYYFGREAISLDIIRFSNIINLGSYLDGDTLYFYSAIMFDHLALTGISNFIRLGGCYFVLDELDDICGNGDSDTFGLLKLSHLQSKWQIIDEEKRRKGESYGG